MSREFLGGIVCLTIISCIIFDALEQNSVLTYSKPILIQQAIASEEVPAVPMEVLIEIKYDWTEERVKQEIDKVFPDAPIMKKVAWCESRYKIDAFNPTNNSDDQGIFQISTLYHGKYTKRLGLDMNNPIDNIKYARILYDESGLDPWIWSKPCWSK